MAWAVRNSQGEVSWVGFDSGAHLVQTGQSLVEITDDQAIAVMEGRLQMADLFQTARPQQPKPRAVEHVYTRRYPALMWDRDVDALAALAAQIPQGGIAAEVGSRLGGSAKIILEHAPHLKRLYCFDPEWKDGESRALSDPYMDHFRQQWQLDTYVNCFAFAQALLADEPRARLLPLSSPYEIGWWTEMVDFMFEDSGHENPQLSDTLEFWTPLVKSGGIIAGHDYGPMWSDVQAEADALAKRLNTTLQVRGTVWWLIKP